MKNTTVIIDWASAQIHEVASKDDTRYVLKGIYIDAEDKKIVATDGCVIASLPIKECSGDVNGIVPTEAWKRLLQDHKRNRATEIRFTLSEKHIEWDWCGKAELIVGKYPSYKQVIPGESAHKDLLEVGLDPDLLLRAVKALGGKKGSYIVTLNQLEYGSPIRINKAGVNAQCVLMPARPIPKEYPQESEAHRVIKWLQNHLTTKTGSGSQTVAERIRKILRA